MVTFLPATPCAPLKHMRTQAALRPPAEMSMEVKVGGRIRDAASREIAENTSTYLWRHPTTVVEIRSHIGLCLVKHG